MNDFFFVYGSCFDAFLYNFNIVLNRCIQTNLVLNFEKCHFMVEQGIVLGHIISSKGIDVDPTKISIISQLPYPSYVREFCSFLGHVGFTSALSWTLSRNPSHCPSSCKRMLTSFFMKDAKSLLIASRRPSPPFLSFRQQMEKLHLNSCVTHQIMPWELSHLLRLWDVRHCSSELHHDRKRTSRKFFDLEKFKSYLLTSPIIVLTDHVALKILLKKTESKPWLIRWIFWL